MVQTQTLEQVTGIKLIQNGKFKASSIYIHVALYTSINLQSKCLCSIFLFLAFQHFQHFPKYFFTWIFSVGRARNLGHNSLTSKSII